MDTFAELLRKRVAETPPSTFGNSLDALRFLRERAIKGDGTERWVETLEALDVLEGYIFKRATADELHDRVGS